MTPITQFEGIAAPLPLANVDTDKIIPGRFLKTISREGLGSALFDSLRREAHGRPRHDFVLNRPPYNHAAILVALENFGCGSSREHAPWALRDFGFRCIIAPSFADIFYNNCVKNGILPAVLSREEVDGLIVRTSRPADALLGVDLRNERVVAGSETFRIAIAAGPKRRLLEGLDEIALTLAHEPAISAYEDSRVHQGYRFAAVPMGFDMPLDKSGLL
jgi:3-isopropylmalate/(R)-2-methylmalate dehydratase small subunit